MSNINYPPEEIYNPPVLGHKNFELIILWMLNNNEDCEWSHFTQEPLNLRLSTLSKYLTILKGKGYAENISRGHYKITSEGKKRYLEISSSKEKERKVSYPPSVIRRRRNYDHWILWMVYNNTFCRWADFLAEPISINQSSLSKNMNLLLDKKFIEKEEKKYRITRSGKLEYSRMLQEYDLDRQSILDEESKRIEEITKKTTKFFGKYDIKDENLQYRFLNNVLKLDYTRVESMLTDEEDFDKIVLYVSMNHPDEYPNFISKEEFSTTYEIKESKLEYYIDEIIENNIYPIKFFKLIIPPDKFYYFQENETLEIMLRAITEDHITKRTYLNKLFSRSLDIDITIENILDHISRMLFKKGMKKSLKEFLPEYINYLAFKFEAIVEFRETNDKLEGIIWHDMIDIFQSKNDDVLEEKYQEDLHKLDRKIMENPEKLELYNEKIKILIYYERYNEVLNVLEEILLIFPDDEKEIKMKEASVLRRLQKVEAGLKIIEMLIEKYPEDSDFLNYKAYWLQYLDEEDESLELSEYLVNKFPKNGTYHDTYGEILMYFEKYDNAIKEFLRAIELAGDDWYIHQTYIKLGICYKELKKIQLAVENLKKGIEITTKEVSDPDTKQKWLSIANLFLAEIEQLEP
ncbi:MAG: tetratricopeptide repeat protein [Promethearchaeota archaeon]|jgi:tetratricopeptide (TPR) repeat protein